MFRNLQSPKFCISFSNHKYYTGQVWDYPSLNEEFLNSCLNDFDWDSCLVGCNDINIAYRDWFSNFQSRVEQHIRRKTVVVRPRDKPWMNGNVRRAIRKRNRLLIKFIQGLNHRHRGRNIEYKEIIHLLYLGIVKTPSMRILI